MKRILITGVTGNLGIAAGSLFADADWRVEGLSRSRGRDLSSWYVVDQTIKRRASFDIVLMAHGSAKKTMIPEINEADWDNIIGDNLKSAAILSGALIKHRKLNPGALVVYCSSIQATQPRAGRGLYAIAKAGLEALARTMAVELAPDARAIALRLGQMESQMGGMIFPEAERGEITKRIPLPWVGFEDTARLVMNFYDQPSLSGEVIEISSLHKFSIWPEG